MLKELQEIGLSYYESKAVQLLLSSKFSMKELSKKAAIPYGKIFSICNSLQKRGIIQLSEERPKKAFIEQPSEIFSRLITEKQNKNEESLAKLRKMITEVEVSKTKHSNFFDIGTTAEDNQRIQLRTFQEANEEVCQILNVHHKPKMNRRSKTLWEKEIAKAVERGVAFRAIYPKNIILPNLLARLHKEQPRTFQVKRLDTDFPRCDIIDGKNILLKLVHEDPLHFGGVFFIEDEKLARNLQAIFEHFWEEARDEELD